MNIFRHNNYFSKEQTKQEIKIIRSIENQSAENFFCCSLWYSEFETKIFFGYFDRLQLPKIDIVLLRFLALFIFENSNSPLESFLLEMSKIVIILG